MWWWYFERCGMTPEELVEDAESVGCLKAEENAPPILQKRSLIYTLKFPPQHHKLAPARLMIPQPVKAPVRFWRLTIRPER